MKGWGKEDMGHDGEEGREGRKGEAERMNIVFEWVHCYFGGRKYFGKR
jgi:hypothetical protein